MAISVNRHTIVGRLGSDPAEIGSTGGVRLSVATSESWKDRDGNKQERTVWHIVVIWPEPTAKFAKQYAKKGDMVYVEGQIEHREYDRDGTTQKITETVIRPYSGTFQIQPKEGSSGGSSDRGSDRRSNDRDRDSDRDYGSSGRYGGGGNFSRDIDDDIPF